MLRVSIAGLAAAAVAVLALSGTPTRAATTPCPTAPQEASPQKGPTGYETPASQPTEKSAILPAAPQNEQSAAPTVQQDKTPVASETECPQHPTDPNAPNPKR